MLVNDGGKGKAWLLLQQLPQWCATKAMEFSSGGTLTWSGENLGRCKTFKFDSASASIDFFTKAENSDEFCPTSMELVLNDDQKTTFFLDNMDCDYSGNTNTKYTAKILQ